MPGARPPPDEFWNTQYGSQYSQIHRKDPLRKLKRMSKKYQMTYGPPVASKWNMKLEGYDYPMTTAQKAARGVCNN